MKPLIERSTEIAYRTDFALLCNARGYKDAVEVGVDIGVFAKDFMTRFNGNWLFLVDPYEPAEEFPHDRMMDAMLAAQAMAAFHGRVRFIRGRSPDVIPFVVSLVTPEFAYIDGAHDHSSVLRDLQGWWDALPDHGMLAGHDYDDAHPGVVEAVNIFAARRGRVVRITRETACPPSWYIYKTEPPTLHQRLFLDAEIDNDRAVRA